MSSASGAVSLVLHGGKEGRSVSAIDCPVVALRSRCKCLVVAGNVNLPLATLQTGSYTVCPTTPHRSSNVHISCEHAMSMLIQQAGKQVVAMQPGHLRIGMSFAAAWVCI